MQIEMDVNPRFKCVVCNQDCLLAIYETSVVTLDLTCAMCGFRHIRVSRNNSYKFYTFKIVENMSYYNDALHDGWSKINARLKTISSEFIYLGKRLHIEYNANLNPLELLDAEK